MRPSTAANVTTLFGLDNSERPRSTTQEVVPTNESARNSKPRSRTAPQLLQEHGRYGMPWTIWLHHQNRSIRLVEYHTPTKYRGEVAASTFTLSNERVPIVHFPLHQQIYSPLKGRQYTAFSRDKRVCEPPENRWSTPLMHTTNSKGITIAISCNQLCERVEHVGPLGRAEKSRADPTVSLERFAVTS
ncbi:hypothetical protein EVAR_2321_1 [Eumeta japonica]|uniref:Uncharacterized protein n=1 Tax=Eumeta variegata TaxID=151549 RepID=A0A4C1SG38_EUMVA|nr:hypothetical protein EVAR_2321_1 [Eumeta japonica]